MKFEEIRKTGHYKREHESNFPWNDVLRIIIPAKVIRKKGNKVEYKSENYYILGEVRNNTLWIINAKRR